MYTKRNPNGRAPAAYSGPFVLSNEDLAALTAGIDTDNGKTLVGNMREKFRETFNTKDVTNWDFTEDASDKVFIDGNAASESYAVFSKSAIASDKSSSWLSKKAFKVPYKINFGMSLSQRVGGEEFAIEMVGVDVGGAVVAESAPAAVAILGTVTIASNVATVNSAGTRTAATVVPLDSTDSAASSTPGGYSANPTPGTAVGAIGRQHIPLGVAASQGNNGVLWDFGAIGKPVFLSGTAQGLALNANGATIAGAVLDVEIEWYEST